MNDEAEFWDELCNSIIIYFKRAEGSGKSSELALPVDTKSTRYCIATAPWRRYCIAKRALAVLLFF